MSAPKLPEAPTPTENDVSTSPTTSTPSTTDPTSAAQQSDNLSHALAGAGGGLLAMTLTYPLVTLSTRAQVESQRASTSTLSAARHIISREGLAGLYSGLDSALFGISVTNFVYYYWYEWTRAAFEKAKLARGEGKRLGTLESMAAGAVAGSATVLITNPIWVVNTRVTAHAENGKESKGEGDVEAQSPKKNAKKPSTLATLLQLIREEGVSSLMAGVLPALVLVINPILQYTIYEQLKNMIEKRRKVGATDAFMLGALGKLLATSITYPYITVKSRAHVAKKREGEKSVGTLDSLRGIVRDEGYGGLYKGEFPVLLFFCSCIFLYCTRKLTRVFMAGIGPKVSQSVLTAAFLFAFKDVLYEAIVAARRRARAVKV
jgi:solute carrier family 25 (peroxisomal adenine nucleotide transporter), member 17